MTFLTILFSVFKFWDLVKDVITLVSKMSDPDLERFKRRVKIASLMADEGDTSGYEDIING